MCLRSFQVFKSCFADFIAITFVWKCKKSFKIKYFKIESYFTFIIVVRSPLSTVSAVLRVLVCVKN